MATKQFVEGDQYKKTKKKKKRRHNSSSNNNNYDLPSRRLTSCLIPYHLSHIKLSYGEYAVRMRIINMIIDYVFTHRRHDHGNLPLKQQYIINDTVAFHALQKLFCHFDFRDVLLNGVLYWSTSSPVSTDDLLCYDIEKDSVRTLKFPKMPVGCVHRQLHYFGVCSGGLRLIENYYKQWYGRGTFASSFDVMEMNQLQLQQQYQDHQDGNTARDLWTMKYRVNIGEDRGYYANLIRDESLMSGVFILDLYQTTTKAARGEVEEEVLLMCINNSNACLVISFNLPDNNFGKELRHNELLSRDNFFWFYKCRTIR